MRKAMKKIIVMMMLVMTLSAAAVPPFAASASEPETAVTQEAQTTEADSTGQKAYAAAIAVGLAAAAGAIAMGIAIAKSVEGISRQPEAEGKIRTSLMLGLVFVETAIIYALIIAILIIFVL